MAKFCFGDRCFQIAGIKPYDKKDRENLDYFYIGLWLTSVIYQILILAAFFWDFIWLGKFLDRLVEPYSAVVGGYGGMRLFFIDPKDGQIKLDKRNRKTRTGHRFVFYWWLVFALMGLWTIFYPRPLIESSAGTAMTIALLCTIIAIGYQYGKYKINNNNNNSSNQNAH